MSSASNLRNSPRAFIHLKNIQSNFDLVRSLTPEGLVMAVVKADAYGHGAVRVSEHLRKADALGVSRVVEGLELRAAGIDQPIVVLAGFLNGDEYQECQDQKLTPVVHSEYQLDLLDGTQPAWLKLNSGMNRLGFNAMQMVRLAAKIGQKNIVGVMSHLANSDEPANDRNLAQIELFKEIVEEINHRSGSAMATGIASSGAILGIPESQLDLVRPGVMLYGGSPTGDVDNRLRAGMTLSAPVISINALQPGDAIGYGGLWTATRSCRVAVVGLGYADGYPREMPHGTPVLVNHQRRKLVGRISMDMCFVELDEGDQVNVGDAVIFWGDGLPIDEIAQCAGTISLNLMSGLTKRVEKIYQ